MIKIILHCDFPIIQETLTRMGVANNRDKKLFQSCHILKKSEDQCFIAHFKELMATDGKSVDISDEDLLRTYSIARTLEIWGLVTIPKDVPAMQVTNNFKVIKASSKDSWTLIPKYTFSSKD